MRSLVYFVLLSVLAGCSVGTIDSTLTTPSPSRASVSFVDNARSPEPHLIGGTPFYEAHDDAHNIVWQYSAFTLYYDDTVLAPRWTSIKVTSEMADLKPQLLVENFPDNERPPQFYVDEKLARLGYATTKHSDYNNVKTKNGKRSFKWHRGHMVPLDDARGYGYNAAIESFYVTNITPQLGSLNSAGWFELEQLVTEFARDYGTIWVYTGPVYDADLQPFEVGRKVPSPIGFYKIISRLNDFGEVDTLSFYYPHEPTPKGSDFNGFLKSVDAIEAMTDIDFFPEYQSARHQRMEMTENPLWEDIPDKGYGYPNAKNRKSPVQTVIDF